jgi:hypothetical protein
VKAGHAAITHHTPRDFWQCRDARDSKCRNYESEQNEDHGCGCVAGESKGAWRNDHPNPHGERSLDLPLGFGCQCPRSRSKATVSETKSKSDGAASDNNAQLSFAELGSGPIK